VDSTRAWLLQASFFSFQGKVYKYYYSKKMFQKHSLLTMRASHYKKK